MKNFTVAYGLIVKTNDDRVMLIKRKVPYCIHNFYIFLHNNNFKYTTFSHNPFNTVKDIFEENVLPRLGKSDRLDYFRFIKGEMFEDLYDFPHGQLIYRKNYASNYSIYKYFYTAYREFVEETGFKFNFTNKDIEKYQIATVEFTGCNGIKYKQIYFIVENVKGLRRSRYFDSFQVPLNSTIKIENWDDDRLVYEGQLLKISEAIKHFKRQQSLKIDYKHLLLEKTIPISRIILTVKNSDKIKEEFE